MSRFDTPVSFRTTPLLFDTKPDLPGGTLLAKAKSQPGEQTKEHLSLNVATETNQFIEDVVVALIGSAADGERPLELPQQVERASHELDAETAESFGSALVENLCADSSDLGLLEALLVLAMAHPEVARRHRVDLVTEGKRFALLLERTNKAERAKHVLESLIAHLPEERSLDHELAGIMRRNGDVEELIDRYLARADEAVASRHPLDAVPWLQEVLLLDRTRRDVARMIRDLRYSEEERKGKSSRRNVVLGIVVLVSMVISAAFVREGNIRAEIASLPSGDPNDLIGLKGRLAGIEDILENRVAWLGMYGAINETNRLNSDLAKLEVKLAREAREASRLAGQRTDLAEAARERGLMLARSGQFEAALRDLRHSLELTTDSWEHRERVLADVAAIENHKEGGQ